MRRRRTIAEQKSEIKKGHEVHSSKFCLRTVIECCSGEAATVCRKGRLNSNWGIERGAKADVFERACVAFYGAKALRFSTRGEALLDFFYN
jgi:hypothetical protein